MSIKGVVIRADRVLLLKNDRAEWELPGGRLELGETPEECVAREIHEETGWSVTTGPILDSWLYYIEPADTHVFVVTYGCHPTTATEPVLSHEHKEVGLFTAAETAALPLPAGYQRSITTWFTTLTRAPGPANPAAPH